MSQKTRAFDFRVKAIEDSGAFAGYVSVYEEIDFYRERVAKGAFNESLASRAAKGRKFPILFQHNHADPIGTWTKLEEDERGLYGEGQLWLEEAPTARVVHRGMKDGAIDGLSIGYFEVPGAWAFDEEERVRTLTKVNLIEASVVVSPANDAARIDAVKAKLAAGEEISLREFESVLREKGFSRSEAAAIAASGFKSFIRRESDQARSPAVADIVQRINGFTFPKI
jgi:HK97 family phage prohead protease